MLKRGGLGVGRGLAVDERQVDRAVGVGMGNGCADVRVNDLKRDLLAAFTGERLAGRLAGFDLPADELPMSALRLADRPPAEEKLASSAYDAAYNLNHFPFHSTFALPREYSIFWTKCAITMLFGFSRAAVAVNCAPPVLCRQVRDGRVATYCDRTELLQVRQFVPFAHKGVSECHTYLVKKRQTRCWHRFC